MMELNKDINLIAKDLVKLQRTLKGVYDIREEYDEEYVKGLEIVHGIGTDYDSVFIMDKFNVSGIELINKEFALWFYNTFNVTISSLAPQFEYKDVGLSKISTEFLKAYSDFFKVLCDSIGIQTAKEYPIMFEVEDVCRVYVAPR